MERQEAWGEMAARFTTDWYGLSLGHWPWPKDAVWMIGDTTKAIPYLLRCSYREFGVLAPEEREALIEQVMRLIESRRPKCYIELQEFTASLADRQEQGLTLPDMKETDPLEHKRLALGRWFRQQLRVRG
jgi:hypothetical protein